MTFLNDNKPSLEDVLEHHGVKGQKWGKRGAKAKVTTTDINNARAKVGSQVRQINAQIDKTNLATGKQQEKEAKKLSGLMASHLKNPDRLTAARMTRGEKAGTVALALVPGIGTASALAVVAVNAAGKRAIKKQIEG